MNYILFDDSTWNNLKPLSFTRPVAEIRVGIMTIKEKWEKYLNTTCSYYTETYLRKKYPLKTDKKNILINSSVLPDEILLKKILQLCEGQALVCEKNLIAFYCNHEDISGIDFSDINQFNIIEHKSDILKINELWDIFSLNAVAIDRDFKFLTNGRVSEKPGRTNQVLGDNFFIEKGAKLECCVLNSITGPVYIGKDTEIMEGSAIRGPFALCNNSTLKLNSKIYGATTIGPHAKVGGEINNSVIFGYSNKAHDGFLGQSVIGEWCNIGADSNNSNLKNNYAEVKLWDYNTKRFKKTGLQFCGLIMADHSKCAINTMFNTGTVVGVSSNIFGSGFPRNFIPDFSWGGAQGFTSFDLKKVFEIAEIVMARRSVPFTDIEKEILVHIFEITEEYRKY
ncbi:MAG: GlmU family protein [Bacteroidota bacterium]